MKWIKVYFTQDQYDEWKSGNGRAIGYREEEIESMKKLEKLGHFCSLKTDPLNYMTKVDPRRVSPVGWAAMGVFVE